MEKRTKVILIILLVLIAAVIVYFFATGGFTGTGLINPSRIEPPPAT